MKSRSSFVVGVEREEERNRGLSERVIAEAAKAQALAARLAELEAERK